MNNVKFIDKNYQKHFKIGDPIFVSGSVRYWLGDNNKAKIGKVVGFTPYRIKVEIDGVIGTYEKVIKMDEYDVDELTTITNMMDFLYLLN